MYDWLGDIYSSYVNPLFWKLHGWVDDRIEDWKKANPEKLVNGEIQWVGKMPSGPNSSHEFSNSILTLLISGEELNPQKAKLIEETLMDHLNKMEQAIEILAKCEAIYHFYDDGSQSQLASSAEQEPFRSYCILM